MKSHAHLQTHTHARTHIRACDSWAFLPLAVQCQSRAGTVGPWRGGGGPDWRVAGIIRAELKLPKEQPIVRAQTAGHATASGVGPVRHAPDETSPRFYLRLGAQVRPAGFPSAGGTSGGASEGFLEAHLSSVEYFGPVRPPDMEYTSSPKPQLSSRANAFSIAALMSSGKSSKDKDTEENTIKPLGKHRPGQMSQNNSEETQIIIFCTTLRSDLPEVCKEATFIFPGLKNWAWFVLKSRLQERFYGSCLMTL